MIKTYESLFVTGSLAYDVIMTYDDLYAKGIVPEDVHHLNLSFVVNEKKRYFGGTAGNIVYNLQLLKEKTYISASLGADGADYEARISLWNVEKEFLYTNTTKDTATAFITTDKAENQIAFFYPGAMSSKRTIDTLTFKEKNSLVIISPDDAAMMEYYVKLCTTHGVDYVFDPGQGLFALSEAVLLNGLKDALLLVVNSYEYSLVKHKTKLSDAQILALCDTIIITQGEKGAILRTPDGDTNVPAFGVDTAKDPTGCGDAFRAGLLYGIKNSWGLAESARLGSLLGSFCVQHFGTQTHTIDDDALTSNIPGYTH